MKNFDYIVENIVHQQLKNHLNESNSSDIINNLYINAMEQIQEMFPNNKELSGGYMFITKEGYFYNISEPIFDGDYFYIDIHFDLEDLEDSSYEDFSLSDIKTFKKYLTSLKSDAKRVIMYINKLSSKIEEILKLQKDYYKYWNDDEACPFTDEDYNDYRIHQLFFKKGKVYYSFFYDFDKEPQILDSEDEPNELFSLLKRDNKRKIKLDRMDPDEVDKRKDGEIEDDEDYDEDDE